MWPFNRGRVNDTQSTDLPPVVCELLALLEKLKKRDWRCDRVFRASEHRYELNQCLSDVQLAEFESQHKVVLPHEYREFLQYAGNGGAGPDYGLIPLQHAVPKDETHEGVDLLSLSFEHTQKITRDQHSDLDDNDPYWDYFCSDRFIAGCIFLAESGCGNYDILVVNGPTKGTVWSDWRGSDVGCLPQNIGFYEWYRNWLEGALDLARLV